MRTLMRLLLAAGISLAAGTLRTPAFCQSPPKRALLVAVNGYADVRRHPAGTSVHDLDTTLDVTRLRNVLKTRWKFQDNEIKVLQTPAETTHQAIMKAFKEFLIDPALKGKGAVIFFHYSGHGSQWPDKADPTGLDQTLVPSDYKGKNDGSNDVTDKELAGLLKDLSRNQPSSVLLSFDSCHSGTITRGGVPGKERGFARDLPAYVRKSRGPDAAGGIVPQGEAAQWGYTVISACRSDQSDYQITDEDNKDVGSLSYALCRALSDATATTTCRDIFNRVQSIMLDKVPSQEPQIEGSADQVLFSDKIEKPDATIGVYTRGAEARLQAGFLMGVTPGTQITLYRRDTKKPDDASRIGTALVGKSVDSTEAVLVPTLVPGVKFDSLQGARAVITQRRYTGKPLQVDLSAIAGHPQEAALRAALEPMRKGLLIAIAAAGSREWDVRLVPPAAAFGSEKVTFQREGGSDSVWSVTGPAGKTRGAVAPTLLRGGDPTTSGSVALQFKDGTFLPVQAGRTTRYAQILDNDNKLPDDVREALHKVAMAGMLRALKAQIGGNGFLKAQIQIAPCKIKMMPDTRGNMLPEYDGDTTLPPSPGGGAQFTLGQYFYIKTQNLGPNAAYLTVLDTSADGSLSALWPYPNLPQEVSTIVPAGQKWQPLVDPYSNNKTLVFIVTEPLGRETLWAIATEKPTNFAPILSPATRGGTRGAARGAEETPFGRMLRSSQDGRRSPPANIETGDFALTDYIFTVNPVAKP